jgi:hypothetical protein
MKRVILSVFAIFVLVALSGTQAEARTKKNAKKFRADSARYICSYNAYNCSSFASKEEANLVFLACGGKDNDIHRLDFNKDGIACGRLK